MIVFDEQSLQLPYQNNHDNTEHLGIVHVVWRLCDAFHHSDLYQVLAHVVGETATLDGWCIETDIFTGYYSDCIWLANIETNLSE